MASVVTADLQSESQIQMSPAKVQMSPNRETAPLGEAPTPLRADRNRTPCNEECVPKVVATEAPLCVRCGLHPTNKRKALNERGLCCNKCPHHGPWCTMHDAQKCAGQCDGADAAKPVEEHQKAGKQRGAKRTRKIRVPVDDDDDEDEAPGRRSSLVENALRRTEQAYDKQVHKEQKKQQKRMRDDAKEIVAIEKRFKKRHSTLLSAVRSTNEEQMGQAPVGAMETPAADMDTEINADVLVSGEVNDPKSIEMDAEGEPPVSEVGTLEESAAVEAETMELDGMADGDLEAFLQSTSSAEEPGESTSSADPQDKSSESKSNRRRSSVQEMLQKLEHVHSAMGEQGLEDESTGEDDTGKDEPNKVDDYCDLPTSDEEDDSFMKQVKAWLLEEEANRVDKTAPSAAVEEDQKETSDGQAQGEEQESSQAEEEKSVGGGCEAALLKVKLLYNKLVDWTRTQRSKQTKGSQEVQRNATSEADPESVAVQNLKVDLEGAATQN